MVALAPGRAALASGRAVLLRSFAVLVSPLTVGMLADATSLLALAALALLHRAPAPVPAGA